MRSRAVLLVAACALLVAGCSNPTYSRETVEHDLRRDAGLSESQAECVAQRLEDTVGERRLGARDEPTAFERDKTHAALLFAIIACSGSPYDRAGVERDLERKATLTTTEAQCLVQGVEQRVPTSQLASAGNLQRKPRTDIGAAIFDASVDCGADGEQLRRNTGLSRDEIKCVTKARPRTPAGDPVNRRAAFVPCTTAATTTTTTSTTTRTGAVATTSTS